MSSTPPENNPISDSWVDLSGQWGGSTPPLISTAASPRRVTPVPFGGEHDYLRMLREAQKESNKSSTKVSPISSALMSLSSTPKRNTPSSSPKSPPNSPNPELATFSEELRGVYVNKIKDQHNSGNANPSCSNGVTASDIVWDWTSKPTIHPKEWQLPTARSRKSSESSKLSIRTPKAGKKSFFSKEVVYTLVITNILSLLLGTGIGIWLSKKGIEHSCSCCGELIEIAL